MTTPSAFRDRYGRFALVAGASEGIGADFARQLAARGLDLVLVARRAEPLAALAHEIERDARVEVRRHALDLALREDQDALVALLAPVDLGLVVYNAALSTIGPFLETPLEAHLRELDVNTRGPLVLVHALAPRLVARRRGGVILMSSMSGFQGTPLISTYAATKAWNTIFAEGLWDELRGQGVDVLACVAGSTRTPGFESSKPRLDRFAPPVLEPAQVVAEALAALGSGPTLVPGRLNRAVAVLVTRLMSRRRAVQTIGNATRKMYGTGPG